MNYDVVSVKALDHLRLYVTFKDQTSGEVVLSETCLTGVFEQLKDPSLFFEVNCKNAFVEWPNQIDLAPDEMYQQIREHGKWIVEN